MFKPVALLSAVAFSALALAGTIAGPVRGKEKTVLVGGARMFSSNNIIQNALRKTTPRWWRR